MIVERWTFNVKEGCWDKMRELLKAENAPSWPFRTLNCQFGTLGRLQTEGEFEDLTALQKAWTEWDKSPGSAEWRAAFGVLHERNSTRETWMVE